MDDTETEKQVPLATVMWSTSLPDRVRTGLLRGITSSTVTCPMGQMLGRTLARM